MISQYPKGIDIPWFWVTPAYCSLQGELCVMPSELDVQLEVERLSVRDFARRQQEVEFSESYDTQPTSHEPPHSNESRDSQNTTDSKSGKKKKHKYVLPLWFKITL